MRGSLRRRATVTSNDADAASAERSRILAEYRRRAREVSSDLYAPWQPDVLFARSLRVRAAATMLKQAGVFPRAGRACMEVGFGSLGWMGEFVSWGLREGDLHGIDLDPVGVGKAREILPGADLRLGDASQMPWIDQCFQLVVASTIFTSILDVGVRRTVAREITRVLAPGGALLWYDFAVNNPRNPNVRKVDRRELRALFPDLHGNIRSVTLAPPLARWVVARSWVAATLLEALPPLRTHLVAVLVKKP